MGVGPLRQKSSSCTLLLGEVDRMEDLRLAGAGQVQQKLPITVKLVRGSIDQCHVHNSPNPSITTR